MARSVLHLASWLPYPAEDGGRIASWSLARCLRRNGYETDLLCISKSRHIPEADLAVLHEVYRKVHIVEKDTGRQHPRRLVRALVKGTSYFVEKYCFRTFEEALRHTLERRRYEVTLVENAYMALYLPLLVESGDRAGRIVVRLQNVEYELFERLADHEPNPVYRWLLRREAKLFKHHELALARSDVDLRAITSRDAAVLSTGSGRKPAVLDPYIDAEAYPPGEVEQIEPHSLVFVGNLAWPPNRHGLMWFHEQVWTEIRDAYPDSRLVIVGKRPPRSIRRLAGPRVEVTGYVADVREYVRNGHLFVAPLLDGSGVRIKILMALAMGKPVLSTRVGAEGIDYPGVAIEASAEGWVAAVRTVFDQPPAIDARAVEHIRSRYDWRRAIALEDVP